MTKKLDLSLYLILDPTLCGGTKGMVETTKIAIENGVTMVQLRAENNFTRLDWYESALLLKKALENTTVPLIINDMVDVALAVDADGVHIGQNDLPAEIVRKIVGPNKILGLSTSNSEQINSVPWDEVSYIGVGPVFPTTSKHNAPPDLGIDQLKQLYPLCKKPAVAIGGINKNNINSVLETGFDGVAVVSAICGTPDVSKATKKLMDEILKYRR